MQKPISAFLRSFSFRAGTLIFIALCIVLIGLRFHIYLKSVGEDYEDIRYIINAHAEEINQGMRKHGLVYVKDQVNGIIDSSNDKHLYLALYYKGNIIAGNLKEWPYKPHTKTEWKEISISQGDLLPLYLLTRRIVYRNQAQLLIGYDLQRVEQLRYTLVNVLLQNMLLSFLVSFFLSIGIVWLINKHLQRFNIACNQVMAGKLSYRVAVRGVNDQFDQLSVNINRMLDWINTLLVTVKDSTNALAHDMRTPLSRHRLELAALIDDPSLPAGVHFQLQFAIENVDTLVEMFDNILNISKAESRSSTELFEVFDFAEVVRDVLDFYAALFEEKSLDLITSTPDTKIQFSGDKQLISQAVVNLIDNAIKYTPYGGTIQVALVNKTGDGGVYLMVADNGPGIPAEFLEKAKERFFRLDESRSTKGTGLGLSLVNAVAELHKGKLILEDNSPGLKSILIFLIDRH